MTTSDSTNSPASRRGARALFVLFAWTAGWVLTLAFARFGPNWWGSEGAVLTWFAVALNIAVGIGWIVAYAWFLRALDELQRRIQVDAMAAALGVGVVGGCATGALISAELLVLDAPAAIAAVVVAMAVGYLVTIAAGTVRYR
ncbi:hypothetical protein [Protaetiibacter mangrovi]|uniref:Uncharacterized protein n=1 Tax=Protaetiibacter mangrovi TaxID=2970926 RepID=A0ABT1ZC84_9MICO|nr:hypothetical protein [Protaetiibacter mangrovi]MCS0498322.1 hypothetical protein [Protaetiibacter mangrovi]TPX02382.1 hypothetical protein FJ656_22715 [Schumannella luteola]